jgi:hypothetical protein
MNTLIQPALSRTLYRTKAIGLLLAAASCLQLAGCAEDRSTEDWNREQIRRDLGKLQTAAGTYRGTVYSNLNQQALGELELTLTTSLRTLPGSGATKAEGQPILMANVLLRGARNMALQAQDSYYDPDTGTYRTNIPVVDSNGKTVEISLTGHIHEGIFDGTIQAGPYVNHGGTFSLTRNGAPVETIPSDQTSGGSNEQGSQAIVLGTYQGTTRFHSGAKRTVYLVILSPKQSSQEDFLSLFVPVKSVQVTLNYGESLQLLHQNAEWDQQTGTLRGTTTLNHQGENLNLALDCRQTQTNGQLGWECRNFSNTLGQVATTQVIQTANSRPTYPITPGETEPVWAEFQGKAQFLDGSSLPVTLSALYPARTREEELVDLFSPPAEKVLQVTLTFGADNPISVFFDQSRWDARTGRLNGRYLSNSGRSGGSSAGAPASGSYDISLTCTEFQFTETKTPFHCSYFSNRQGRVELQF